MSLDALMKRRSIRRYKEKKLTNEQIEILLKAGMQAPSAGNGKPWQFIVVDNRDLLIEITKVHPYSQMLKQASHAIIVCGDVEKAVFKDFWQQDCSAVTENILIAIQEIGLGGVWLGTYPNEERCDEIRKIFNIPSSIIPFSIIAIGYPDEEKNVDDRFDEKRIHYNNW